MKDCCSVPQKEAPKDLNSIRIVLWIAMILNASMFVIELSASFFAHSVSLQADAVDFLGDAANYGISLFVLTSVVATRAKASLIKSASMLGYGLFILGYALYRVFQGEVPHAPTMSGVGFAAMAVNFLVAILLYRYRDRDSNMQSVWLCTRNDVIGNMAVILAAGGVFLTVTKWPDLIVASVMGGLSLQSSYLVFRSARKELRTGIPDHSLHSHHHH